MAKRVHRKKGTIQYFDYSLVAIVVFLMCFVLCFCCVDATNNVYASESQITPRLTYVSLVESSFFIDDKRLAQSLFLIDSTTFLILLF